MKKFFLDTNVLIDIVAERKESSFTLKELLLQLSPSQIFLSTLSIPTTYYIFKIKKDSKFDIKVQNFIDTINLVPLDENIVNLALENFTKDFEDTLQYYSALSAECNYILTRDIKDFKKIKETIPSKINIITDLRNID